MATNKPYGDNAWKGAVRDRTQVYNPVTKIAVSGYFHRFGCQTARRNVLGLDPKVALPPVSRDPEAPCFCGSGKKYRNCHMPLPKT
jgi:hypothetical protein